jgi:very-short-patch-repair endonuclease
MGACLWGGDETALSFAAAGRVWGFDGFEGAPVEVSLIGHKRAVGLPFRVHRVSTFLIPEIVHVGALPVTSVRRTLLDLAGVRHPRTEGALDQALLERQTTLGQVWLLYEEEWTRGRRGIAILRGMLAERTASSAPTQSELERLLMGIVHDFSLPPPVLQHPINLPFGCVHADFCYPEARLVIETDGYAVHSDRASFENDRERDAELLVLGWRTLRFTWAQLKWRREWVAEKIRAHLAATTAPSGT